MKGEDCSLNNEECRLKSERLRLSKNIYPNKSKRIVESKKWWTTTVMTTDEREALDRNAHFTELEEEVKKKR